MHSVISKIILASFASSLIFSTPSTSVYERAVIDEVAPTPLIDGVSILAEVTSYTSEPGQTDDTPLITASGTHVHDGTIACPRRYKFGTRVEIGGKFYTCEDRMSERFPDRFDIWMESNDDAIAWGIRTVEITIK